MRRTFSVLSIVAGAALALLGAVVGLAIGPDDVATLPSTTTVSGGARTALTAADLFPYRNATVEVAARNAGGTVFVGVANPVDVGSYLTDVTRLRITKVDANGTLSGKTTVGTLTAAPVAPETTTFWDHSTSGSGTQRLDVALTGEPVSIVVVSGPTGGALTVTLGVAVPHGFVTALATTAAGLVLVGIGIALLRRGGRTPSEPVGADVAPEQAPSEPVQSGSVWSRSARAGFRPRLTVLGLAGATILTGCAALPERVDTTQTTPVRTAILDDEILPAFASYDERNNAAIALSVQSHDPSGWEAVDSGAPLRSDVFSTLLAKARGETAAPYVRTTSRCRCSLRPSTRTPCGSWRPPPRHPPARPADSVTWSSCACTSAARCSSRGVSSPTARSRRTRSRDPCHLVAPAPRRPRNGQRRSRR
ncbi:hypothetical protein [Cellulomonas sp. URHB0016]